MTRYPLLLLIITFTQGIYNYIPNIYPASRYRRASKEGGKLPRCSHPPLDRKLKKKETYFVETISYVLHNLPSSLYFTPISLHMVQCSRAHTLLCPFTYGSFASIGHADNIVYYHVILLT